MLNQQNEKSTQVYSRNPTITATDVQDDEEVVIVAEDDEVVLTEYDIENLFQ